MGVWHITSRRPSAIEGFARIWHGVHSLLKRIHVVGLSPRTGTTLMVELLVASFKIDGHADHEMSVFGQPDQNCNIFCSKLPGDLLNVGPLLRFDPRLWVINMVRDPRDVVVSRHARAPSKYWVHLGIWKQRRRAAKRLANHPRFITVRYEDLVNDPDRVQRDLERRMPFLERTAAFSEFHKLAMPSERAIKALGGVRPIDTSRVGNWRRHKSRLVAQIATHGDIDQELIDFNYETDRSWRQELDGVMPDNDETFFPERRSRIDRMRATIRRSWRIVRYILNVRARSR
jgi:hypothetical protein